MDTVLWGMVRKDGKEPAPGLSAPDAKRAWATLHHVWVMPAVCRPVNASDTTADKSGHETGLERPW